MLGITVADAVLIVGVGLSILAAWRGTKAGASAAGQRPPDIPALSIGGGALVDSLGLRANTDALNRVADALEEIVSWMKGSADQRRIHELEERLARLERP